MSWKLAAIVTVVFFDFGWSLTDLETRCISDFNEDFNNDLLTGTWYWVMHFALMGGMIPTTQCPTFIYEAPNATELQRYKDEYLRPNVPFSFDDPVHEDGGQLRPYGLVIGNKQAKFFIMDPKTHFFRPPYVLRIYERINDNFIVFHECNMRRNSKWLMSRNRNPSSEEVEAIIKSRPDLIRLRRQWFCALR